MKPDGIPIRAASRRTGLSPHAIRAWERRYRAVSPSRSPTNRRLYSAHDVEKLSLLRAAVAAGHSIGQIASLTVDQLRGVLPGQTSTSGRDSDKGTISDRRIGANFAYLDRCMEAIMLLDEQRFDAELGRAAVGLGEIGLAQKVLAPLLERIGERWRTGDLRVAHEHMASAVIRSMLGSMREGFELPEDASRIVITTPAGHLHEFGALLVANAARLDGWHATYLGPNLPASEIAGAALGAGAKLVALSLIYPPADARTFAELRELRRRVGNELTIIVGGRASETYTDVLREIAAVQLEDLGLFLSQLERLRRG